MSTLMRLTRKKRQKAQQKCLHPAQTQPCKSQNCQVILAELNLPSLPSDLLLLYIRTIIYVFEMQQLFLFYVTTEILTPLRITIQTLEYYKDKAQCEKLEIRTNTHYSCHTSNLNHKERLNILVARLKLSFHAKIQLRR